MQKIPNTGKTPLQKNNSWIGQNQYGLLIRNQQKKIGHPAPFPEELPFRLIQLYSFKNDIILDPFMGSGTSGLATLKSSRKYIGYEINNDYVKMANERIKKYLQQPMLNLVS